MIMVINDKYLESLVFQFGGGIFSAKMVQLVNEALGLRATLLFH